MKGGLIKFYGVSDEYGDFSNFAASPIRLDGQRCPTSEHYLQAQEFEDEHHREAIRRANSPMVAARMGRDRKKKLRRGLGVGQGALPRASATTEFLTQQ